MKKSLDRFVKEIYLTNAMIAASNSTNYKYLKNVFLAFGAMYYFFLDSRAKILTQMQYSKKNIDYVNCRINFKNSYFL